MPVPKLCLVLFITFFQFGVINQTASSRSNGKQQQYYTVYEINAKNEESRYVFIRGRIHLGFEKYRVTEAFRDSNYDSDVREWIRTGRHNSYILAPYCLSIINKYEFEDKWKKISKFDNKIVTFKAFVVRNYRIEDSIASGDCEFSTSGLVIDLKTLKLDSNSISVTVTGALSP